MMCVVSMVGDHYNDWFKKRPEWQPFTNPSPLENPLDKITRQEFDQLKKEIEQMKELLKKAVEYDIKNNEPACEIEDKVALLKKVAEVFGVDLSEVFKK